MNPKRIGFLVYPSMQALDLAGPMDAFAAQCVTSGRRSPRPCRRGIPKPDSPLAAADSVSLF